jgi:predicted small secreted protein
MYLNLGEYSRQGGFILDSSGNNMLDYIGKYETMGEDLKIISENINLNMKIKGSYDSTKKVDYKKMYTRFSRKTVGRCFSEEIKMFDYKFG